MNVTENLPPIASEPPSLLDRIEDLLMQAEPRERPATSTGLPVIDGYRLEAQLTSGCDGIAYIATELRTGRRVEYRRLSNEFRRPEISQRLRVHMSRLSYAKHPAIRRVLHLETTKVPVLICCPAAAFSWHEWRKSESYDPATNLHMLCKVCAALSDLNRCGIHLTGSLDDKLGVTSGKPLLDCSGINCFAANANSFVTDEEEADETAAFATFVSDELGDVRFKTFLREYSPRLLAQLNQMLQHARSEDTDAPPALVDFQDCLNAIFDLVRPSCVGEAAEGETAQGSNPSISPDTQQVAESRGGHTQEVDAVTVGSGTQELDARPGTGGTPGFISCDYGEPGIRSQAAIRPCQDRTNEIALFGGNGSAAAGVHDTLAPEALGFVPSRAPRTLEVGSRLGRYVITGKLGEGGMGAVFRAQDSTDDRVVAIKVLHQSAQLKTQALRRFQKEARLLASLKNPYITNLIEVSEEDGLHYFVLEYVAGVDVHKIIEKRGTLPVKIALHIAADVSRALLDAHQRDLIHRDIKPENILVENGDHWLQDNIDLKPLKAKLTDFGIARQIDQSQSLAVTQVGGLLGTPLYMSPEQCKGGEVGPQSDVYSLGITLFEMLTGRTPFQSDEPLRLIGMHCYEPAPSAQRINPLVTDAVAAIIAKCLAKNPGDRYADAETLLEAIEQELQGKPSNVQVHPLLPAAKAGSVCEREMIWELKSSPEILWPYVSNTDRVNRAMGLPAVEYTTQRDTDGRLRRYATAKIGAMSMRWEEHPYEWIEGRRMSVLREFEGGPFLWFSSTVELEGLPEGGSRLKHSVRLAGRNWFGRLLAKREAGAKCQRVLDVLYARIDAVLSRETQAASHQDPFENVKRPKAKSLDRIDARLEMMEERGVPGALISKFRDYLLNAAPQDLGKIRPLVLCESLRVESQAFINACLVAADVGLLRMEWDILCPTCRTSAETKACLRELAAHTHCEACAVDFQSDLANSVELVFRIQPDIIETRLGNFCLGGPAHTPHVVAQVRCEPGERIELPLALDVGDYLLRGPNWSATIPIKVLSLGAPTRIDIDVVPNPDRRLTPTVRAPRQLIVLANRTEVPQVLRLERTIPRDHVITAAQAMALPGFRELFPTEVLDPGRLISAENVTLLSTHIGNIDACYSELGDRETFDLIQKQIDAIQASVRSYHGDVVKIVGEGVLAVFTDVADSVRFAFQIRSELRNNAIMRRLKPVIGIHRGSAIVTTVNQRLDYFGAASRLVQSLPQVIQEGIVLTEPVFADPLVQEILKSHSAPGIRVVDLPGQPQQILQVF